MISMIQFFAFFPGVFPWKLNASANERKSEGAASTFSGRASDSTKNRIASTLSFLISAHHSEI